MPKLEDSIREIIRTELGLAADHPIEDDWPLYSLGADSLDHLSIIVALEKQFGVDFGPREMMSAHVLNDFTVPFFVDKILEEAREPRGW